MSVTEGKKNIKNYVELLSYLALLPQLQFCSGWQCRWYAEELILSIAFWWSGRTVIL